MSETLKLFFDVRMMFVWALLALILWVAQWLWVEAMDVEAFVEVRQCELAITKSGRVIADCGVYGRSFVSATRAFIAVKAGNTRIPCSIMEGSYTGHAWIDCEKED